MIVLTIFAFVGLGVRLWISYDQEMRKHEAAAPRAPRGLAMSIHAGPGVHHPLRRAGTRARHRPRPRQEGRAGHAAADRAWPPSSGAGRAPPRAAFAIAVVCVNFLLSAALITWTARISIGLMMGAVLFGYLLRLGLIFLAIWLVKDASWVELVPLGITLIVTHLGLLFWELRYVSASLAFPGLKPLPPNSPTRPRRTVADVQLVYALEFPEISEVLVWPDFFAGFNKVALINVLALVLTVVFFWVAGSRDAMVAPDGRPQRRRVVGRVHRGRHRHADDGPRGPGLDAVPADAVRLHLPDQHHRHHPDPADAGQRPHGRPAGAGPDRVGHLHRRRLQAPGRAAT